MKCRVLSGCCGFPLSRKRYFERFNVVEVQQTFYDPPSADTLRRWREEAPKGFVFTVKAWQAVTHPSSSPTWRRIKRRMPGNPSNYGMLQLTEENQWAWRVTLEAARALEAPVVVLQTPPSFGYSEENAERAEEFLSWAVSEAAGITVAWEPRGTWSQHREELERLLCRLGVVHVVDPLRREPVVCPGQRILYMRLHGLGGREVNYRYKYTDEDLARLASIVGELLSRHPDVEVAYVMFNNVYMADDAARFIEAARGQGLSAC